MQHDYLRQTPVYVKRKKDKKKKKDKKHKKGNREKPIKLNDYMQVASHRFKTGHVVDIEQEDHSLVKTEEVVIEAD